MSRVRSQFLQSAVGRLGAVGGRWASLCGAVVVAVVLSCGFGSVASAAPKGVIDALGAPSGGDPFGGQFADVVGQVGVNQLTGDAYAVDATGNRVQRFSSSGVFLGAWGRDVVAGNASTGFEVCTVSASCSFGTTGSLGGELNQPFGLAVAANGDVYVGDGANRRIQVFTAEGAFVRAFGLDVASAGADQADELQRLTVNATAGQFRLTFGANTTGDLAFDASAADVQAALNGLASVSTGGGSVTVTGGPGSAGGTTPYSIVFDGGPRANTNQAAITAANGTTPLSGSAATAAIATLREGATGAEICTVAASCKAGVSGGSSGAFNPAAGMNGLAIAPPGSPNAGNLLAVDASNRRVQEFLPTGQFVRAFGWDVTASGPSESGTGFESCGPVDVCQTGSVGGGVGQFGGGALVAVVETGNGTIYTAEASPNFRVQSFTPAGPGLTPTVFNPQIGPLPGDVLTGAASGIAGKITAAPSQLAVGPAGHLLVTRGFWMGTGVPAATSDEVRILEFDGAGALLESHAVGGGLRFSSGLAFRSLTGLIYTSQPGGTVTGTPRRVMVLGDVPPIEVSDIEVSDVAASTAVAHATISPAATGVRTFYRFEYAPVGTDGWTRPPHKDVDIGNGSGGPGDPAACPAGNPETCVVSEKLVNLDFDVTYKVRVVAYTEFNGRIEIVEGPETFTTFATPPEVVTSPASWSSPASTDPSLLFKGTITPGRDRTTYQFQYVDEDSYQASGFDDAISVPAAPGEAGAGIQTVQVVQNTVGIDPARSYRYRLVAANSVGQGEGEVRTIEPPQPTDRFFERVSNGDSWGAGVSPYVAAISDDANVAQFSALGFGQPETLPGPLTPFVSQRTSTGWKPSAMLPAIDHSSDNFLAGVTGVLSSRNGLTKLWVETSPAERLRGEVQFTLVHADGTRTAASPRIEPFKRVGSGFSFEIGKSGASADLSTFVFQPYSDATQNAGVTYFPDEPMVIGNQNLYSVSSDGGSTPNLHIVNRADGVNGAVIGGACGAGLGGSFRAAVSNDKSRAVSDDGSVIYFTAMPGQPLSCPFLPTPRVFKRIDATTTVAVSDPQCTRVCSSTDFLGDVFRGASADGSVVTFTTSRQLVGGTGPGGDTGDTDATDDLYLYDADPPAGQPTLVQASAGEDVSGVHTAGSGADVQGVIDVSSDGSRVYFVANGALTGANRSGASPSVSAPNLYVFERDEDHPVGRTEFVATLDPVAVGDPNRPGDRDILWRQAPYLEGRQARALPVGDMPDPGRYLAFATFAKLVPGDSDETHDLYRYDDQSGALVCVSCQGNGDYDVSVPARPAARSQPDVDQVAPFASGDGETFVFTTSEALLPQDTNTPGSERTCTRNSNLIGGCDVYLWHEGELELITGATGEFGIKTVTSSPAGLSRDGKSVFFITDAALEATDGNGAPDLYVSRVGGGFPAPEVSRVECSLPADACQDETSEAPVADPPATGRSGEGNAPASVRAVVRVAALNAAQRKALAAGRRVSLSVRTNRAGQVKAGLSAVVGKRRKTLAAGSAQATGSGRVAIGLRLSRPARRVLARSGRLSVRLSVRMDGSRAAASRSFVLKREVDRSRAGAGRKGGRA